MFLDTGKQNILLPDKSNKIMFLETGKQNILLSGMSNYNNVFGNWEAKRFAS